MDIQLCGSTSTICYSDLNQLWISANRNCQVIIDGVVAGHLTCTESKVTFTVTDDKYIDYLEQIADDILVCHPIVDF